MKKKINNPGTTDLFFEQLKNTIHIESKDIPFGKEYHFKDLTSNKTSSGTIKRFFLDSEYEIAITKVSGKINYECDLKQMRFGLKIGAGDLEVKLKKIRKFLEGGHKVRIQVVYKGREMAHKEIGYELINKIVGHLEEEAILEQKPQMAGRNLSVVIRSK